MIERAKSFFGSAREVAAACFELWLIFTLLSVMIAIGASGGGTQPKEFFKPTTTTLKESPKK